MNYLKRYGLGDYFNNIVNLVPKMLKSCLPVAIALFLPAGFFYFLGFLSFGTSFELIEELTSNPENVWLPILRMLGGFLWFVPAGLFTAAGHHLLTAMVGKKAFSIIHGEEAPVQPVKSAFKTVFWPLVLQGVIVGALVAAFCVLVLGIFMALLFIVIVPNSSGDSGASGTFILTMVMILGVYLLLIPALYWFFVKTLVAPQAVVREGCGPFQGIKRSFQLVKGNFWRTLGIYLLISMVISFATSMLSGPVVFIMILPGYIDFIKTMFQAGDDYSATQIFGMFKSLAPGMGIAVFIQYVFYYILYPIFGALMYTDLTLRKGEIAENLQDQAVASGQDAPVADQGAALGQP